MLIKFFRSSFLIQYFFLVLVTAAIWIPGFLSNQGLPVEPALITPLYNIAHYLLRTFAAASPAAALVIIIISAFTLNNILVYHELTPKNNLLPAFLFILLMGSNPQTLCTYPVIIALPFFMWFLHSLYRINDSPDNYMEVFNAGMLISVISMIYPLAIIFFVSIWLILLVYGVFNGRNLIISVIALLLPFLYLALYFFWTDQLNEALNAYRDFFVNMFTFQLPRSILQLIIWIVLATVMIIPAYMRITGTLGSFNINIRKKMSATAWLLAFSLPIIIFSGQVDYHTILFIPASIMIAYYYNLFKKSNFNEIVLLVFLFLVLLNNYIHLFRA